MRIERASIFMGIKGDIEGQIDWLEDIRCQTELSIGHLYASLYSDMANLPDIYDAFIINLEKHLPEGLAAGAGLDTRLIISELSLAAKAMIKGDNLPALWMATLLSCHFSLVELVENKIIQHDVALRLRCFDLFDWARCFRPFSLPPSFMQS